MWKPFPKKQKTKKRKKMLSEKCARNVQKLVGNQILRNLHCGHGPTARNILKNLSQLLNREIHIWKDQKVIKKFGKNPEQATLNLEFRSGRSKFLVWTLRDDKQSSLKFPTSKNCSCLFEAISAQTGFKVKILKNKIFKKIRSKISKNKLAVKFSRRLKYSGNSKKDANAILEASQRGKSHPSGKSGHPRGHASHPDPASKDSEGCVENYSKNSWKTGFLSFDDQDYAAHLVLSSNSAKEKMDELINGKEEVVAKISINELDFKGNQKSLKISEWQNGKRSGELKEPKKFVLVLRHFQGRLVDEDANVFVHTFYPL